MGGDLLDLVGLHVKPHAGSSSLDEGQPMLRALSLVDSRFRTAGAALLDRCQRVLKRSPFVGRRDSHGESSSSFRRLSCFMFWSCGCERMKSEERSGASELLDHRLSAHRTCLRRHARGLPVEEKGRGKKRPDFNTNERLPDMPVGIISKNLAIDRISVARGPRL